MSSTAIAPKKTSIPMSHEHRQTPKPREESPQVNVGEQERLSSAAIGGALFLNGLTRGSLCGAAMALLGGSLLYRGFSGHCSLYKSLGVNTASG